MKSVILLPYCPLPPDSGAKSEMWKHLETLKALGDCRIVSACSYPVGAGWTPEQTAQIRDRGFAVTLREEQCRTNIAQYGGLAYAAVCKALRLEKAFGHSNPYHRHAFPVEWWKEQVRDADLAVINYSYWARLPCPCPKAVVLHDLWSDIMWGGARRETEELKSAQAVIAISKSDEATLKARGLSRVVWSPPLVPARNFPLSDRVGMTGSSNRFNCEGLQWLQGGLHGRRLPVHVFGRAAAIVLQGSELVPQGSYRDWTHPYEQCGVILLASAAGTGVQIKAVEALACGRAIVARKGAMRGLPENDGAWVEVSDPGEMVVQAIRLCSFAAPREELGARARQYYERHLNSDRINAQLKQLYAELGS